MINKGTLVGHDSTIGNYSVLAPNVTLGGNVNIGNSTYIGTGASIRNGINIGNNVIVGMGAVVIDDVEDEAVVVGNPAKFIKKNEKRRVFEKIATPPPDVKLNLVSRFSLNCRGFIVLHHRDVIVAVMQRRRAA